MFIAHNVYILAIKVIVASSWQEAIIDWPGRPAAAVTTCECVNGPDKMHTNTDVTVFSSTDS